MHYKKLYPTEFIDESDLPSDTTVKIAGVKLEDLQLPGTGSTESKVVLSFCGAKKRMVLNKTNAIRIAAIHGNETSQWVDKEITLYFDPTVKFAGQVVGGVRVRVED